MNSRLKKLIEEKAWETLTEHGYNDSQLFEQLKKKVVNLFSEQFGQGDEPNQINSLNGMVFYFPFSFTSGVQDQVDGFSHEYFAGAMVLGADAFNELGLQELNRQFDEHYNNGGSPENFQPDWSAPGFEFGMNWSAAEIVIASATFAFTSGEGTGDGPASGAEAQELAVLKLMQKIASMSPGAIAISGIEGYTRRETRENRGNRDTPLIKFFKKISQRIRDLLEARGYNDAVSRVNGGQGLSIPRYGDQPFFPGGGAGGGGISGKGILPPDFRASKGGLGGGLGGPGGRMAPPSQPPQQRIPRMPGRGFGGGQGMPTPGFAPPTPPVQ